MIFIRKEKNFNTDIENLRYHLQVGTCSVNRDKTVSVLCPPYTVLCS